MELLIELLGEIRIELYGELMMLIVPEEKRGKRFHIIAKTIAIAVLILIIATVVAGIILIENQNKPLGIGLLIVAGTISLIQITLGIIFYKRNHPADKKTETKE